MSAESIDIILPPRILNVRPHSNHMTNSSPPDYHRPVSMFEHSSSGKALPSAPKPFYPPVPPRSPLRPRPHGIVISSTQVLQDARNLAAQVDDIPLSQTRSYSSLTGLLESMDLSNDSERLSRDYSLPSLPDSPLASSINNLSDETGSSSSLPQPPPAMSKRAHALLELLSSERAYASDLALIRDIHIPLALGQPTPFNANPVTPPSSGSSTRTVSTASDSSTSSSLMGPPMTREDTKVIFGNIADLAMFSDKFVERLEGALGSVLDGETGDDTVGALFLEIIPAMEPPYKAYITRHPAALSHLNSLPPSPALTAYLARSKTLASSLTHAWDLPSLLIKPVQRLLKYSLLLTAIIAETPDSHPDKECLIQARGRMEEVARGVNEDRRRWEVIKEVLSTKPGGTRLKGLNVTTTVGLGRIRSSRSGKEKEGNKEAELVAGMERLLRASDAFIKRFAKEAVGWAIAVKATVRELHTWAVGFAHVIGLSTDQGSEAFDAFLLVIEQQLVPLVQDLDLIITNKLLVELAFLADSMRAPLRLLEAMNTLQPHHYSLLNANLSKNRPPPALVQASESYLALRGQLYAELPQYLKLLDKGIAACILQLAQWQTSYWADVRDRWSGLWDALRVDGEMNAGATETQRVWWTRWAEVSNVVQRLNIVNAKKIYVERPLMQTRTSANVIATLTSLNLGYNNPSTSPSPTSQSHKMKNAPLEPGSLKVSRKSSKESMRSGKSGKLKSSRNSRQDDFSEYAYIATPDPVPMPTRTKSMPLSNSGVMKDPVVPGPSRAMTIHDSSPGSHRAHEPDFDGRGRLPRRKSSIRQKVSESLRASSRSSHKSIEATPPPPGTTTFYTTETMPPISARHSAASYSYSSYSRPTTRALYACRVIHPCNPPDGISYRDLPFFTLRVDAAYEVLKELGHPSLFEDLPLYIDDGEDCLLLVRDNAGDIGWALASFLIPLD